MPEKSGFAIGVDVGGTFTDIILAGPKLFRVLKVPTSSADPSEAVVAGIAQLGHEALEAGLLSHATTLATNALLSRSGVAKTALVTNEGFRDVLEIGRQRRPEVYDLSTRRPVPLVPRKDRFTVRCRVASDGREVTPIDDAEALSVARKVVKEGFQSVAISFLNSYVNGAHERAMGSLLVKEGFRGHVSLSSEVDRQYREYERTSTTVVNAALSPLMSGYLSRLVSSLIRRELSSPVYVMRSDGGAATVEFASARPVSVLESGPAAGVVASAHLATSLGLGDVLTFDMGGTTAKAGAVIDGKPDVVTEFEAAGKTHSGRSIKGSGYPVRGEFIDLAEVSAGGGTMARLDDAGELQVGPDSAGSVPGPACYGKGGSMPTVTDANVVLGRLNPKELLGGKMPIREDLARASLQGVSAGSSARVEETAVAIIKLVNDSMARAISIVSVERGRDPRDFTLLAFGGAGPSHACDLAEELGVRRIFVPVHAGLFSAYGLLAGELTREFSFPIMKVGTDLRTSFTSLEESASRAMRAEGFRRFSVERYLEARYAGQSHELLLPYRGDSNVRPSFDARHKSLYGYSSDDPLEVVNIRVKAKVARPPLEPPSQEQGPPLKPRSRMAWVGGARRRTRVYRREGTPIGSRGRGPCIVEELDSTIVVNPSWEWRAGAHGMVLSR